MVRNYRRRGPNWIRGVKMERDMTTQPITYLLRIETQSGASFEFLGSATDFQELVETLQEGLVHPR